MNVLLITEKDASADQIKSVIAEQFGECEFVNCTPGLAVLGVTGAFQPDLTVIHLNYRDAEGPGLVRHLKSLERPGYVILIVEADNMDLIEQAVEAGADEFIKGGFDGRELSIRLARYTPAGAKAGPGPEQDEDGAGVEPGKRHWKYRDALLSTARVLGNVAFGCLLVLMAVLAFFLVQSKFSGGIPTVFGNQMYIVLSGSMNPAFDTGSLAFVRAAEPETIAVGDIITFGSPGGGMLTTHRVVDVHTDGGLKFTTRGDANNVNDPNPVPAEHVIGRVYGTVPYLGYLMGFSQTRQGLIFLVFIPGVLVIIYELRNIYRYMGEADNKNKKTKNNTKKA